MYKHDDLRHTDHVESADALIQFDKTVQGALSELIRLRDRVREQGYIELASVATIVINTLAKHQKEM